MELMSCCSLPWQENRKRTALSLAFTLRNTLVDCHFGLGRVYLHGCTLYPNNQSFDVKGGAERGPLED